MSAPSPSYTAVFRSSRRSACEERALVLLALSIPHLMEQVGEDYVLLVDPADGARALSHLESYEAERRLERDRRAAPPAAVMPLHRGAWIGCVFYAVVLIGVAWMITAGYGRLDAFDR